MKFVQCKTILHPPVSRRRMAHVAQGTFLPKTLHRGKVYTDEEQLKACALFGKNNNCGFTSIGEHLVLCSPSKNTCPTKSLCSHEHRVQTGFCFFLQGSPNLYIQHHTHKTTCNVYCVSERSAPSFQVLQGTTTHKPTVYTASLLLQDHGDLETLGRCWCDVGVTTPHTAGTTTIRCKKAQTKNVIKTPNGLTLG